MKIAFWVSFISYIAILFLWGHARGERDYYKQQTKEWSDMCIQAVDLAQDFRDQRDSLYGVIDSIK